MTAVPPPPQGTYVPPTAPAPQPQPAKSSSGCLKWGLIGCGVVLVLGIAFVCGVVMIVFGAIKSSDAYRLSFDKVRTDPRVVSALGAPVESGWLLTGSVDIKNGKGSADIRYTVHGSKEKAWVNVVASREPDQAWEFSKITVEPDNGSPIDVLSPP